MMAAAAAAAAVFVVVAALVLGTVLAAMRAPAHLARRRLEQRLRQVASGQVDSAAADLEARRSLIKTQPEGPLPALDRLVIRTRRGSLAARWIEQAGLRVSVSALVLMALGLAGLLAIGASVVVRGALAAFGGALAGLVAPVLLVRAKRAARLRRFEEQFPEALDLMSRAVRAGHALTTGLKMVADELGEPVGPEFRKTFDEQNFGLPLKDALSNLAERVPIMDVRFFATAVLIQRETGGNLAEILDNLAHVVRERFKIRRQVRVYTAHGRLTGYVLLALPAALAVALSFINPDHMNLLFRERMGQTMIGGAILMQVLGYLWIRRIVRIEV